MSDKMSEDEYEENRIQLQQMCDAILRYPHVAPDQLSTATSIRRALDDWLT